MCSAVPQWSCFVDAEESRIQFAKCSDMSIAVLKGLGFAGTKDSCFEAWKRLNIGWAALLCGRFADVQELSLKPEER